MPFRLLLIALMFCVALPVHARGVPTPKNDSVESFLAFHDDVARRASTASEFKALSRTDREQLSEAQADIRTTLAGKQSMSELDDEEKVRVFNAHETVVAVVNKAADERMVCIRKKRIGSHRHELECRTVAQRRAERESIRNASLTTGACNPNAATIGAGKVCRD